MLAWWHPSDGVAGFDVLVTPTIATPPPPIGYLSEPGKGASVFELLQYTAQFNVTGQPAISLPLHLTADGLPVGVQFVAAYGREDLLVRLAAQLEIGGALGRPASPPSTPDPGPRRPCPRPQPRVCVCAHHVGGLQTQTRGVGVNPDSVGSVWAMAVTVRIPTTMRPLAGGASTVQVEGGTLADVLADARDRAPRLQRSAVRRDRRRCASSSTCSSRTTTCATSTVSTTAVPDGETVSIIPAVAGG